MSETHAGRTRSYRPGEWFAVFGDHATVILPPSEKHRVPALWELVDGGAGFEEVLDALLDTGLRGLPAFVLVSEAEGETRIVIRGDARASFATAAGPVDVDGSRAATWVERTLSGVTRMTVEVADTEAGDLTVAGGLVRAGRVDEPPYAPEEAAEQAPEEAPEEVVAHVPEDVPEEVIEEVPEAAPAAGENGEETIVEPLAAFEPADAPTGPFAAADLQVFDAPGGDRDRVHVPPPAAGVPGGPVARLLFSSGEEIEVDRAVVVGRAPKAGPAATGQPRLVSVPSPNLEISSTHLEIRPGSGADHGRAVVIDRGSTNGTVLVQPGMPPEDLRPEVAVRLQPGAILDLGDGVTIQVATA